MAFIQPQGNPGLAQVLGGTPPIIQPRQQQPAYDPMRESMLAQLLSMGQMPARGWGDAIGNIAKTFVASRGLKKQGQARRREQEQAQQQEAMQRMRMAQEKAALLRQAGIEVTPEQALVADPNIINLLAEQNRKQAPEPVEPKIHVFNDVPYTIEGGRAVPVPGVEPPVKAEGKPDTFRIGDAVYERRGDELVQVPFAAGSSPQEPEPAAPTLEIGDQMRMENRLTDKWQEATKSLRDMRFQQTRMHAGLEAARAGDLNAGSQAVLVTFQKVLDPESVVRESEYARSPAGQGLMDRIRGIMPRLQQGGPGVTLAELETFVQLADEMVARGADTNARLQSERERIERRADRYGIPHEVIFEDFDFAAAPPGVDAPTAPVSSPAAPTPAPQMPVAGASALGGLPAGTMVRLRAPDGSVQEVPASQAQHYIGLGAQVVQ